MVFDILNLRYCNILILIIYFFAFHSVDRRVDIKSLSWTFFRVFFGFSFFILLCVHESCCRGLKGENRYSFRY